VRENDARYYLRDQNMHAFCQRPCERARFYFRLHGRNGIWPTNVYSPPSPQCHEAVNFNRRAEAEAERQRRAERKRERSAGTEREKLRAQEVKRQLDVERTSPGS